ncbi:formin-like protein 14 isoform X2 [Scyliorhinus canicula]|nr:formin-like protein 14 isoform X2 [Scyliorhinus canicula]
MGGLFQGGFPVLRPTGQRDASERGSKPAVQPPSMKMQTSRYSVQNDSTRNDKSASNQPDLSKVQRATQGRLNISAITPPPLPVTPPSGQSKPLPMCPFSTPSTFNNKPTKTATTTQSPPPPIAPSLPPPLPPPPPMLANVTPFKYQYTQSPSPPPPPPPPSPPPSLNFQDQTSDFKFPAPPPPSFLCTEDCTDFPLPPFPPPPPAPSFTPYSKTENALPPPPPPILLSKIEVPPSLPPKLPSFSNRPCMSSISPPPPPPPPTPPPPPPPPPFPAYSHPSSSSSFGQTFTQLPAREGPSRSGGHSNGGKLASPPLPPVRSSSTELTSRNQHVPLYSVAPPPPPPPLPPPLPLKVRQGLSNAQAPVYDDFESKYHFHSVEDLPPPDEYKSFPRIYPSKQPRVSQKGHRATTPLR